VWVRAVLARVHCLQGRYPEAEQLVASVPSELEGLDPVMTASVEATAIRVLVGTGDLFQAGLRAEALGARVAEARGLPLLIATIARFRVFAAGGHLDLAAEAWKTIDWLARELRTPLRALRARLLWTETLDRAGRSREAHRERRVIARLQRVAPEGLRRTLEKPAAKSSLLTGAATPLPGLGIELITTAYEQEDDAAAVKRIMARLAAAVAPIRLDLVSSNAGPASSVLSVGIGMMPRIAQRVLEAGICVESDEDGGREIGVPIRCSGRLVGGFVARWPCDRMPPEPASELLGLAAAVAAPRVDALLAHAREASRATVAVPELVGVSAAMTDVRKAIERAARAPFAVLIEGESGVGKELAARAIHHLSVRRERAFCDINCAALADELLESELFGHAKGAFTGAVADKPGLFEQADGGTLFLDELADLSPRGQAKLLRAIQQQEVRRVGETFSRKVDVRIVAAANRDLRTEVAAGRFRADLLFRLDVVHLRVPPLRERPEDIPVLARHCWEAAAARVQSRATLTHGVMAALASHAWPGNVRELQNVIAALAVAAPAQGAVRASLLPPIITAAVPAGCGSLADARLEFERRFVRAALARACANRTKAARELGLSRQGLLKTMARLGLEPPVPANCAMDATGCS
jgi:DNA-binding NtrC family response regulator